MQAASNTVVSIDYTLTDSEGEILDQSEAGSPLVYLHGADNIIPGLEAALTGKSKGDSLKVTVEAADGYGEYDESLVAEVERDRFPGADEVELGDQFQANTPDGPRLVTVIEIADDTITIDANHPLAGETLNFDVKVVDIRVATSEEIAHGHVHGPDGHHHH
ncbi:MAG TPA: peptidylprolyl isomerase [Planctomycetaceae bacterium]|nr:peptidylprolyl isomerase [Planctomycetaceae bacterium]